jgi:replication-associated recombination protein RarA
MPPTKGGYDFGEVASLLQKSLRRGDVVLASRAMNELFPQYTNYAWNRLMTVSAEDCAGVITTEIVALYDAWSKVNTGKGLKDKGRIFLAKAIVLLATAKHSRDADTLNLLVSDRLPEDVFAAEVAESEALIGITSEAFDIPAWVYDVHTMTGKRAGKTKQQFIREEEDGLVNKVTVFENLDELIESPTFRDPSLLF